MRALFAALALVVSVAGCSELTGPGSFNGTYDLERVNGRSLPYVVDEDFGYRLELTRSSLRMERDGYYETTFTWRETIDGRSTVETERYTGTFEREGNDVWLYDDFDGSVTRAYWSGNRLLVTSGSLEYEYR